MSRIAGSIRIGDSLRPPDPDRVGSNPYKGDPSIRIPADDRWTDAGRELHERIAQRYREIVGVGDRRAA